MSAEYFPTHISKKAFIIFILASSFFFYDFVGQVYPGVMSHELMKSFSINATQLGIMTSCFFWAYAMMQVPAAMLLNRFGGRQVFTIVITLCALSFLLFSSSQTIFMASIARFTMGMTAAFAFIGTLYFIVRWFPPKYFALFAGATLAMGSIGAIIVNKPLAIIMKHFGWREGLIIISILGFILASLVCLIIRNSPTHSPISYRSKDRVIHTIKPVLCYPQTWTIAVYSITIWGPILAFAALWGTSFLTLKYHLDTIQAAQAIAFVWFGIGIGSPLLGWLSDLIGRRCTLMSLAALINAFSISCIIFMPYSSPLLLHCLLFLFGIGAGGGSSLTFAVIKDNHSPKTNDAANGLNNMIMVSSGVIMQPLIGKILDLNWHGTLINGTRIYDLHSYYQAFSILPICYLIALFMSLVFIRETHCKITYTISDDTMRQDMLTYDRQCSQLEN